MKSIWNKMLIGFINGIVILLPIVVTMALIRFLVIFLNNLILQPLMKFFAPMVESALNVYIAKSIIFVSVILAVMVIGWAAKILFVKRIFSLGERIFIKVPIMGKIYNAAKQIFSAFLGHGKTVFKQVIVVEYPRKGLYSIGFTTGTTKGEIKELLHTSSINVFIPTTPNPTSGMFIVVPRDEVQFLKMSVEDGMKMIVSGGSVTPPFEVEDVHKLREGE